MASKKKRGDMTPEELQAIRDHERLSGYERTLGRGGLVSNSAVRERLSFLIDTKGITAGTIAKKTGVSIASIVAHHNGHDSTGRPLTRCIWRLEQSILNTKFGRSDQYLVKSHGAHRRVQALVYKGYSYSFLAAQLGLALGVFHRKMQPSHTLIQPEFHGEVIALFEKLITLDPRDMGITEHAYRYALTVARKRGFAPEHCWDEDTWDDASAIAEWTGACGTYRGYAIHYQNDIPVCSPCRKAKADYAGSVRGQMAMERDTSILDLIDEGKSYEFIMGELGVCQKTIERVVKRGRDERPVDET